MRPERAPVLASLQGVQISLFDQRVLKATPPGAVGESQVSCMHSGGAMLLRSGAVAFAQHGLRYHEVHLGDFALSPYAVVKSRAVVSEWGKQELQF